MARRFLRGSGCGWASPLGTTGQGTDFKEIGEMPNFSVSVTGDFLEQRDTCAVGSPIIIREFINPVVNVNFTLQEFFKENLARAVYGNAAEITTSTLADQIWAAPNGTAFEEGKWYLLPNGYVDVAALVFKDSAATPATITSTKYTLDRRFGMVKFNDLDGYTVDEITISGAVNQPDTASAKIEKVGIATGQPQPFAFRFKGTFTLDGINYYGIVNLHKVQLEPGAELAFKSIDSFISADMSGRALANTDLPADNVFGNTGNIIWLNEGA